MAKFNDIFQDLVIKRLDQLYEFTTEIGPKIILALIVLLIGWLSALLLKKIAAKVLKALGFDVVAEKTGLKRFLEKGGITENPSSVIGAGFYWLIIFGTLVTAFNTLELEAASLMVKQAAYYLPKIIVAIIFLSLGIFLSKFVGTFVEKAAHLANIPMYNILSRIFRYLVVGLAVMMALEYLGVATTVVVQYAVIIFGIIPLILCLVFLVGGKDILAGILAGRLLLKEYKKGDKIECDSISGKINAVGLISTKLENEREEIIVPNAELAKKVVKKIK